MSTANNNIVRTIARKSLFESALPLLNKAISFNQGDLCSFNSAQSAIVPITSDAMAQFGLGIAPVSVVSGVMPSAYQGTAVDAAQAIEDVPGPVYGVIARLILATGSTLAVGGKVYATSDPQTVTTSGTYDVGTYQGAAISSSAAGLTIEVLITARYNLAGASA